MLGLCYVKAAQHQYLRGFSSLFTESVIKLLPTLSHSLGSKILSNAYYCKPYVPIWYR